MPGSSAENPGRHARINHLRAVSISSAIASVCLAGFRGTVLGVYRRVLNLLVGDEVITLAGTGLGEIPNGVLLDAAWDHQIDRLGAQPGMPVVCDGAHIEIGAAGLRVDFSQATVYPARKALQLPLLAKDEIGAKLTEARYFGKSFAPAEGLGPLWSHLDEILGNRIDPAGFKSPIVRAALPPLLRLVAGLRDADLQRIAEGARSLAGLGIGLTPSGDDLLTGLLAAIVLVSEALGEQDERQTIIDSIVESARGRSNSLSFAYLRHASKGELTEALSGYIAALVSRDGMGVEAATRRLFAYGATSGCELALGGYLEVATMIVSVNLGAAIGESNPFSMSSRGAFSATKRSRARHG